MSLTQEDLRQIEAILDRKLDEKLGSMLDEKLNPILGELKALREDIKEIYRMIAELQTGVIADETFKKKSLEEKILTINAELLAAAKQAGIVLPRN